MKIVLLAPLAVVLLTAGLPLLSARSAGDWASVLLLQPGKRITVRTTAAAGKFNGRLHSATPEGITLIGKDGTRQTFAKTEVTLVRLRGSNAWPFVGAAAASAYPATVLFREKGPYLDMNRDTATIALPVFAVGGALIGKVVQRSTRKMVYDVRP